MVAISVTDYQISDTARLMSPLCRVQKRAKETLRFSSCWHLFEKATKRPFWMNAADRLP